MTSNIEHLLMTALLVLAAGCTAPAVQPAAESLSYSGPQPQGNVTTHAIEYDGTTPVVVCVPQGPNACIGEWLIDGRNDAYIIPIAGHAVSASFDLHWVADTPLTESLRMDIVMATTCGAGCFYGESAATQAGQSPLQLEADDMAWMPEYDSIIVWVNPVPPATVSPVYYLLASGQDFQVAGRLDTVA